MMLGQILSHEPLAVSTVALINERPKANVQSTPND
jgi:hypothetical protein